MFDTIVRGGTVIDGSGRGGYTADLGIRDGVIAEIGRITETARETIDADGALVTPGFIDPHTHYDGQFLWDGLLDPSFSHGVTTTVSGNCGVGFAPVADHRTALLEMMEGVEDIPGAVLDEGLDWSWQTFPEYLDRLAAGSYALDIAVHLTHAPLRVFVMGERALRHEAATREDIAAMAALVQEAMTAGAAGFSTGRIEEHASIKGDQVYGTFAQDEELLALGEAMGAAGRGVFQVVPRGAVGSVMQAEAGRDARLAEHGLFVELARRSGRPVTYSLTQFASDLGDFSAMADASRAAWDAGVPIYPQVQARGSGVILTLDGYHVFLRRNSYRAIAHLPLAERAAAMRDPARRAAILGEAEVDGEYADQRLVLPMLNRAAKNLSQFYVLASDLDFEPGSERTVRALAEAQGKTDEEYVYDHLSEGEGGNWAIFFGLNYGRGNLDHVHAVLPETNVITGLGDGGAHLKLICDAAMPTFQLAFWARDRKRGPRVPVELLVRKLTGDPAALYGMQDRGILAPGKRADVNVIDFAELGLGSIRMALDLPSGAGRLLQGSTGYLATLVGGVVTRRGGEQTGARPGRLVRF